MSGKKIVIINGNYGKRTQILLGLQDTHFGLKANRLVLLNKFFIRNYLKKYSKMILGIRHNISHSRNESPNFHKKSRKKFCHKNVHLVVERKLLLHRK